MENQINGLENGLKRSKNVTKIVVDYKFAKFVTKIMVTKNFGNQIYCDPNLLALR